VVSWKAWRLPVERIVTVRRVAELRVVGKVAAEIIPAEDASLRVPKYIATLLRDI
jgi:hypothetical protein